jgi:hypothetical protein
LYENLKQVQVDSKKAKPINRTFRNFLITHIILI